MQTLQLEKIKHTPRTLENNNALCVNDSLSFSTQLMQSFTDFIDVSLKTEQTYYRALKQFFIYLSDNKIAQPERNDILNFKRQLKAQDKTASTISLYIAALRVFFSWTAQQNIYANIAEKIKGAKLDKEHKKDYLTAPQVKEILANIDRTTTTGLRDYSIFLLMITTGLRTIEVSRANIGDMTTKAGHDILYIQGKGESDKNKYVKLCQQAKLAIIDYLSARNEDSDSAPLFSSTSNNSKGKRLASGSISSIVKKHMVKSGYDSDRLTAHSTRHTAITLSLMAGSALEEVQAFARHASICTTQIYNHAIDNAKNKCSDLVASAIF